MANTLLTPTAITREALRLLHNNLAFVKNIDKQHDKETTFGGQKRGASLQIRLPNQFTVRSGWTLDAQEVTEQQVTLTIGYPRGVDMYFTDSELALSIDDFSKRFIQPAVSRLAAEVDKICFSACYPHVYNLVGTAGTTPATALVYLQAGQKLDEFATPQDDRMVVINPAAQAATVNALTGLFNPSAEIAKQYKKGQMGTALGFDWYMSQNVPVHTTGTRATGSSFQVNATVSTQGSETIAIKGLSGATQTVKAGDVFTVAGVYAVNPETKQSTGALQQFTVISDATASSSVVSCTVRPLMYTTGALQTIDAFPAENATITFVGSASTAYPMNMAFHKEAFTFASANLEMPSDVNFKAQESMDGINIRVLRQYDINNSNYPCRLDIFFGVVAQRPSMACRIVG